MHTRVIDEEDVFKLIDKAEDHFFDRKQLGVAAAQIQKSLAAFANADGGTLALGLVDEKNAPQAKDRWQGGGNPEEFNQYLQAISEIKPTLPFTYSYISAKGFPGLVMLVQVEKSLHVHQTADNTVYVRMGAQSLPVKDPERIKALSFAKGEMSSEDQLLPGIPTEAVVDSPKIQAFLNEYSPKTDSLNYVVNHHLVDLKTWEPKVASILLFAENPQDAMPRQCGIRISRYETREEEPEREHLASSELLEGPLYELIYNAVGRVTEIMNAIQIWTTEGLRQVAYPPEAIWEVLVNAVIHRDYSISDHVHVHIFNNRIEIVSPGKLPGYVTPANILESRFSRNPRIVRTLNRYNNPPNRDMGEGLNTAFQKMTEWRLKSPTVEERANTVVVTIPHASLGTPSEAILEFLRNSESIRNSQAREITGIRSENAVKSEFYKLRDDGYIERVPGLDGSASAWRLTEKGKKAVQPLDPAPQ